MIPNKLRTSATIVAGGAAVVAALSVAAIPTAHANSQWGACAAPANTTLTGNVFCLPDGYPTQGEAQARAMEGCNYLRDRKCSVVVTYTDCGAVAQGGGKWAGGTGATQQAAEQAATSQLPGSSVAKSACIPKG